MSEKFIDFLAAKCSLYISDLKRPENFAKILPVVIEMAPTSFCVEDWNESLCSLFGKSFTFETPAIAKKYYTDKLIELISINSK